MNFLNNSYRAVFGLLAALQKFIVSEAARWGKVVRENNIRAE